MSHSRRLAGFMAAGAIVSICAVALSALSMGSCAKRTLGDPIRLGIMPDVDSLPFMVAAEEGLFAREGVQVELISFSNAQEREAAIQAGQLDGAISDLLAVAFSAASGFDMVVTSATDGRYGIATAPGSGLQTIQQLQGKTIAMSTNTIIQYAVDSFTKAAGIPQDGYTVAAVPKMPVRMEMLLAGQVDAAGLPEPFLSVAIARGATMVASSDKSGLDAAVVVFSRRFLDSHMADVKKMYHAYDDARQRINAKPDEYRPFLVQKASFPEEVRWSYQFVTYRKPSLPAPSQVEAVIEWLEARKLLTSEVIARNLVDERVLAGW